MDDVGVQLALFQSTLSVRRATHRSRRPKSFSSISIHALRKESDNTKRRPRRRQPTFQSTLSVRRATRVRRSGIKP